MESLHPSRPRGSLQLFAPARARRRHQGSKAAILGALLISALSLACRDTSPSVGLFEGPIVVFDIDTLRADHLGCYGYERDTSPRIDALAKESFRFEWVFSQAPDTGPSHASLFTGLYPSRHGLKYNSASLPDEASTLAEILQDAGFKTQAFVDGGFMLPVFNLHQGFERYEAEDWRGLDVSGPKIFDWLEEHADERFFLWIHTYDVHASYFPPEPFRSLFTDGIIPNPGFEPTVEQLEPIRRSQWTENPRQLEPNDLAYAKARYDGGIRFVDHWIGRLVGFLRELDLDDRTTVVLLSDHGEEFQEHGTLQHDRVYSTVTRIPLLIRPPGGIEETVIGPVVQSVDLMPTILEGAGLPIPDDLDGRSLIPLLRGETMRERPAFSESQGFGHQRAITWGDYRLVSNLQKEPKELFHFRRDPLELDNLAGEKPQETEQALALLERLQASLERKAAREAEAPDLNEETREHLKSLGYLN